MIKLFIYEALVGLIGIIAVLIFGHHGIVALVLLAGQPFLFKKKMDENEKMLFKKVNLHSIGLLLAFILIIYVLSPFNINGNYIRDLWLELGAFSIILAHGLIGIKFFISKRP